TALEHISPARLAAHERDPSRAGQFQDPVGTHHLDEGFDFLFLPGDLDHDVLGSDVDHATSEHFQQEYDFRPLLRGRFDFDEHQIALDEILTTDVLDGDHRNDLVELLADLLKFGIVSVNYERHSRQIGVFGLANGQAIDIKAARGQHSRDVCQHPRL